MLISDWSSDVCASNLRVIVRLRYLLHRHRAVCAGVVDENVKRRALSKEAVDGRQVGHVKDRGGSGASRLLNGYRGRFDFFARTRREGDLSPRLRKCPRPREADAPTAPLYQRTAAVHPK